MALIKNKLTNRVYQIVGFENGNKFEAVFSLDEILTQEIYLDDIIDLKVKETVCIKSSRDSFIGYDCVVVRLF